MTEFDTLQRIPRSFIGIQDFGDFSVAIFADATGQTGRVTDGADSDDDGDDDDDDDDAGGRETRLLIGVVVRRSAFFDFPDKRPFARNGSSKTIEKNFPSTS